MSLSEFARNKALQVAQDIYNQANPGQNTNVGSAVRGLFLLPFALIYSAVFQDIESLRGLNLGNFDGISDQDMNVLGRSLLQERPRGSRSTANIRIYTNEITPFSLNVFPYFSTVDGREYSPIRSLSYGVADFVEDDGQFYVSVPVIAVNFGQGTQAVAGEITQFTNLPIEVNAVSNPTATQGGNPELSNSEYFEYLTSTFNDGTLNEIGGISEYISKMYPEAREIRTVPTGNQQMLRDEVWSEDGVNPNLERLGSPFAAHDSLGSIDFDRVFGRAYSASGAFSADMVGKRIAIDGDIDSFRTVLRYLDANNIIISGPPIEGSASAEIWGDGPRIGTMADVYLYFPNVQVQSTVVDKRFFLVSPEEQNGTLTKIYYDVADGFSYGAFPDTGKLVIAEGTSGEVLLNATGTGTDANGSYISITSASVNISEGDAMSLYDMSEINIGTDIPARPVLYVIQVDQLDPLSFEVEQQINETTPGSYDEPGYYISNTDPAEVFSTREAKKIILDSKEDSSSFEALDIFGCAISGSSNYLFGTSPITVSNDLVTAPLFDFTGNEGRSVFLEREAFQLENHTASLTGSSITAGAGSAVLFISGMDIDWMGDVGFRDDVVVVLKNGGVVIETLRPGEVRVYGNTIQKTNGEIFSNSADNIDLYLPWNVASNPTPRSVPGGDIAWINEVFSQWDGSSWVDISSLVSSTPNIPSLSLEVVILEVIASQTIRVRTTNGLPVRLRVNNPALLSSPPTLNEITNCVVRDDSNQGVFNSRPVRVIYATHSDFGALQSELDSGDSQLLCKDTLARSFYPSILDASIRYKGTASSQEVRSRFISLLQTATSEVNEGQDIRLDVSNIIATLDEDGLTDSIDVNFEIRVTNFLNDGETEVRYINPSENTKQAMAINAASSAGASTIVVKRLKTTADVPGRGLIFLGGNNPNTQEVIPYEAVIDNGDGTLDIILRSGKETLFDHAQWETVFLTLRDYDPENDFVDGAIFVPSTNRPYVRQLIVIKEQ